MKVLDIKPRKLHQFEETGIILTDNPHCHAFIDVYTPYIDPSQHLASNREPVKAHATCINESMISHAWTEPLTYRRDNYA